MRLSNKILQLITQKQNKIITTTSTISDYQYFEDSIIPATIREQLSHDPTQPSSVPHLIKGVKWLLAHRIERTGCFCFFFPMPLS